eukprot:552434_1
MEHQKNWPHSNGPLKILIADTWITGITGQRKKHEDRCRYKFAQILMEQFNVEMIGFTDQALLSFVDIVSSISPYTGARGEMNVIIIDSGHKQTEITVIHNARRITKTFVVPFGGYQCTLKLKQLLNIESDWKAEMIKQKFGEIASNGFPICRSGQLLISSYFREINENYTDFTCVDIEEHCMKYLGVITVGETQRNVDGIELNGEQFQCTEELFNPNNGVSIILAECINAIDVEFRNNKTCIRIYGGNSLLKGFKQRLYNEISKLADINITIRDIDIKCMHENTSWNGEHAVWNGAKIVANIKDCVRYWDSYWLFKHGYGNVNRYPSYI